MLFNGFKPLFQALSPEDVNQLSYELIQVFQGEGGTLEGLLAHTASVTSTLADRDEVIGDLIDNLSLVLDHVADRDQQLTRLIQSFRTLVGGLKKDRNAILGSLEDVSALSVETASLIDGIREPFVKDIKELRAVAGNIDKNKAELDRALQVLPIKLDKIGRTAIYGSFFNFYLCEFQGRVNLPGGTSRCRSSTTPAPTGVISDDPKPFRERNPVVVGAVSLVVLALVMVAALRADDLPIIGGGDTYHAMFTEAGGLKVNDEVRIAGVRVGKVNEIELDGDQVKVSFKVDDAADFGGDTRAAIKVKTILGSMFLALEPAGGGQLDEGATIPAERTSSPFDVVEAFEGLASTSEQIDTDQLAESLTTLADLTRNTPDEFRGALSGLSRLSANVAAKDEQLNSLLVNLERVSTVLDARDEDIIKLMEDSDVLFRALVARRDAVHELLVSSTTLSKELTALIRQSRDGPRARPGAPGERRRGAQQERGQPRQQPAADGAVLPRLRQHARHRVRGSTRGSPTSLPFRRWADPWTS